MDQAFLATVHFECIVAKKTEGDVPNLSSRVVAAHDPRRLVLFSLLEHALEVTVFPCSVMLSCSKAGQPDAN